MAAPKREPMLMRIMLYSPILQLKQLYSMDFLMYDRDPGELLIYTSCYLQLCKGNISNDGGSSFSGGRWVVS